MSISTHGQGVGRSLLYLVAPGSGDPGFGIKRQFCIGSASVTALF